MAEAVMCPCPSPSPAVPSLSATATATATATANVSRERGEGGRRGVNQLVGEQNESDQSSAAKQNAVVQEQLVSSLWKEKTVDSLTEEDIKMAICTMSFCSFSVLMTMLSVRHHFIVLTPDACREWCPSVCLSV